jgi:hypothetical protein
MAIVTYIRTPSPLDATIKPATTYNPTETHRAEKNNKYFDFKNVKLYIYIDISIFFLYN